MPTDGDGLSAGDHHADADAERDDKRIVVEESGVGIDIVRERYGMVKYDEGERWYGWHPDEQLHIRADLVPELLEGVESVDVGFLQDSLEGMQRVERLLSGDENE